MDGLATSDVWQLEVGFFPKAAEKGLRPVRIECGNFSAHSTDPKDDLYWAAYTPHTFLFKNPPSREDFWALVSQTPWMLYYRTDYKALVDSNDWPMIDWMHKGARVELKDSQGRTAGLINVSRTTVYVNNAYDTAPITCNAIDRVCGRVHDVGITSPAKDAIRAADNKLKERLSKLNHQPDENSDVQQVIADYLKEVGIAPRSRKRRSRQTV
jgi:hypothetical protein